MKLQLGGLTERDVDRPKQALNRSVQTFHSEHCLVSPPIPMSPLSLTIACYCRLCLRVCLSVCAFVWLLAPLQAHGGLLLTRMSPQAPVLVGCLVLALHASWLSAVRLYPTLGRLPGARARLPAPQTAPSHPPTLPQAPCHLDQLDQRSPTSKTITHTNSCSFPLHLLSLPSSTNWFAYTPMSPCSLTSISSHHYRYWHFERNLILTGGLFLIRAEFKESPF